MKVLHRVQSKAEGPWPSLLFLNQLFSLRKKNKDGDGEDMRRAQTAEIREWVYNTCSQLQRPHNEIEAYGKNIVFDRENF